MSMSAPSNPSRFGLNVPMNTTESMLVVLTIRYRLERSRRIDLPDRRPHYMTRASDGQWVE
jgi:hypothetical protein